MTKRSKLNILSILVLSIGVLLLASGSAIAKFRAGKATSTTVKTSGTTTTKAALAGAAGGVVGAGAARAAMRGSAPSGDVRDDPPGGAKEKSPSGSAVAAVRPGATDSLIFSFDPKGKPDPFKPFVEAELAQRKLKEAQLKKQQQKLPLSPLQRVGIEQFKLVGIGGNEKGRTAVIQDMAGKYYTLSIGTPIGMNNGKVARIFRDRVVVEEPTAGGKKGKTGAKKVEMKLLKEGEEVKP